MFLFTYSTYFVSGCTALHSHSALLITISLYYSWQFFDINSPYLTDLSQKKFMINLDFLQLKINFTIISSANDTYQQMSLTYISLYHFELQSCKSISIKHPVDMRSGLAAGWRVWRAFLVFFRRISFTRPLMTVILSLCCSSNIVFISMRCFTCCCCAATCCFISRSSFTSSFSFVEAVVARCPSVTPTTAAVSTDAVGDKAAVVAVVGCMSPMVLVELLVVTARLMVQRSWCQRTTNSRLTLPS